MNQELLQTKPQATRLKVGYVVKRYPRFSETFVVNEILAHEAAGHAVEIISLYPPNDTHFQNLISQVRAPVTYLSADGLRAADFWRGIESGARKCPELWMNLSAAQGCEAREVYQGALLARLVKERGIGHLHAHFASTAAAVARLAARFAGVAYSVTAHAKDIFHDEVEAEDLRRKLAEAGRVITVSDFNVDFLKREHADASGRVTRVYNGLDLERFKFRSPRERAPRLVSVGRLIEKKGFGILLEASAELVKRGVGFEVVIVGTGEQEAELKRKAELLNLGEHVRFTGALPQPDVMREVGGAAMFAAPCVVGQDGNADGLPTVLLEAMALGTPCIGTDVTGIPEVVLHERTGLMVKQHDVLGLANAMERILKDRELGARLAQSARELMERDFNAVRNAAEIWEWFERCAEERRSLASESDSESRQNVPIKTMRGSEKNASRFEVSTGGVR